MDAESKPTPVPPSSRRASSRLAASNTPKNEDSSMTDADLSTTRSFKGVFINPPPRTRRRAASTLSSPGSNSPIGSFTRDSSVNLDSPATNITTPATSITGSIKSATAKAMSDIDNSNTSTRKPRSIVDLTTYSSDNSTRSKRLRNAIDLTADSDTSTRSKRLRKRKDQTAGNDETANDADVAMALQKEEYGASGSKRRKFELSTRPKTKLLTAASSDTSLHAGSVDDLSSSLSDDSEDEVYVKPRSVKKRSHIAMRAAKKPLPSSRLHQSIVIDDSDSPLSDAVSDDNSTFNNNASEIDSDNDEDGDDDDDDNDNNNGNRINDQRNVPRAWRQRRRTNRAIRERQKLEASHPEIKTMWTELKAIPKITFQEAPQPSSITRKLKGFQLEGLNWMIKQEKTKWRGGLLGDEMGMGKTIQAVSLIMSDYPARQPTLVVVPPVALMQWTNEIGDYTDGKLRVLVYHGTNSKAKKMTVKELKTYDVIMISYAGLESIHRKETKGWTREDKIVKEDSSIHAITFHRIILDEAHSIKSRTTGVAKACFALKGNYKWCLSGTPVQNRIGEFFSLLRFLCVQPFANYFCKSCSCSALHWSVSPDYRCTSCKHTALEHVSVFNQEILNPIISGESDTARKEALGKLRLITDCIMLRRMKRDQTASMELPPKEVIVHNEFFGEIERDFSSSIMTNTGRQFDTYVSRGVMLNNYANIFGLIMQMRQVADHPDLLLKKHADPNQNVLVCNICDEPAEDAVRSRCKHEFCRACVKDFVRTCEASEATADCPRCHITLTIDFDQPEIEQNEENVKKSSIINRIKMENWTSSTKIEMLVYDLYKLRSKKQTLKSIVFSQFTSMLQLIEWRLRRAGFNTVMLDGSMTPAQRQKSIEYFMNNTDVEVFLVSLKAGGVALNLTEASRVFIVDPWWNPAAEWQSADRCHRIGQKRPCVITRLCVEDSVESRIVMLQEKKAHLINGTVNGDDVAMDKLTPEDMQFLFRGS